MIVSTKQTRHVATCPNCRQPHHYIEIKFPIENDRGGWEVECSRCTKPFTIALFNPQESGRGDCRVLHRFDDELGGYDGIAPTAGQVVEHSIDLNQNELRFDYDANPIYRCTRTGTNLETLALAELEAQLSEVQEQINNVRNYMLASSFPAPDHLVVKVRVPCQCGSTHKATFYSRLLLNDTPAPNAREMLLADVDGASLEEAHWHLHEVISNACAREMIARWQLKFDQIIIASPFIAHQWMKKDQKLEIWQWLLGILQPERTLFITRAASYKDYKTALLDSGLNHEILATLGLENRIIGVGAKKQDFHAKVYIGLGDTCEILSGSANLVPGKSMENASFATMRRERVDIRYLRPLGITVPQAPPRAPSHIGIEQREGVWVSNPESGASPA